MKLQDIKKQANSVYDEDDTDEYKNFTDKFKPKKTTDDCFTPDNVYETVADYVATRFNVDRNRFVRPFYPGGGTIRVIHINPIALLLIIRHFQYWHR